MHINPYTTNQSRRIKAGKATKAIVQTIANEVAREVERKTAKARLLIKMVKAVHQEMKTRDE